MAENRQTRESDNREHFQRADSWTPPGLLPEFNQAPGWAYRWIRTSVMGSADAMNVSSKMREGWEPVKLADHPEMKLFADPTTRFKDCVEVGGLLLCKTPEEFVAQRNAFYNKQTQAQTDAINNTLMKENDTRMPIFREGKSTVSFGKGT